MITTISQIEEEKFTECKPYLEYSNGDLYEVLEIGNKGSKISRVIPEHIVNKIRAGTIDECKEALVHCKGLGRGSFELVLECLEQLKEQKNDSRR